jgi:hypothetical protein
MEFQVQIPLEGPNSWDDGKHRGGNFWSDYTGIDANDDGIGDTPFTFDAYNQDQYPLVSIAQPWKLTNISIVTSSSSMLLGFVVNITGTLSDTYGHELGSKTVILNYTFPEAYSWIPIASDNTNRFGQYSIEWIPPSTGFFTIKAEWPGNTTHFQANNNLTLSNLPHEDTYIFTVESNSTISALAFNTVSQELGFTASGPSDTKGYVKITIAKSLVGNISNIGVYFDGNQNEYSVTSVDDTWLLTFDYIHSTHQVVIRLNPNGIPAATFLGLEWWIWVMIPVVGALFVVAFVLRRRFASIIHGEE